MAKKTARRATLSKKYISFKGRMVMIGFGSIGQGVLPLILRHIRIKPSQITIIAEDLRASLGWNLVVDNRAGGSGQTSDTAPRYRRDGTKPSCSGKPHPAYAIPPCRPR